MLQSRDGWKTDCQGRHNRDCIVILQVYIAELMEDLLQCMHDLSSQQTLVLFAYYERSAVAGKAFWDLLPEYFCCQKIPESTYGARPHPDNLGIFELRHIQK